MGIIDEIINRLRYCQNNAAIITDDELMSTARDAVIAIEEFRKCLDMAKEKAKWIPVTERLAEYPCICCDTHKNTFIPLGILTVTDTKGTWQIDSGYIRDWDRWGDFKPVLGYENRITHWMPLPTPPKGES